MKGFRKVVVSALFVVMAVISSALFFACGKSADGVESLVIEADDGAAGKTLLALMSEKEENGEFSYKVKEGMIVEINGVENDLDYNPCWMLYTSDEENSNTMWGEYEYNGETLGSASVGAESLIVKAGEVYVWVYQEF